MALRLGRRIVQLLISARVCLLVLQGGFPETTFTVTLSRLMLRRVQAVCYRPRRLWSAGSVIKREREARNASFISSFKSRQLPQMFQNIEAAFIPGSTEPLHRCGEADQQIRSAFDLLIDWAHPGSWKHGQSRSCLLLRRRRTRCSSQKHDKMSKRCSANDVLAGEFLLQRARSCK